MEVDRPAINIYINATSSIAQAMLTAVLNGIEEEGVFCKVTNKQSLNATELSKQAAKDSRLEVGIGIDDSNVSLTYKLMDVPMFFENISNTSRKLGTNAARLIKNIPLEL